MASVTQWDEWNGAGSTKTANRADCDWKSVDDSTTDYHAAQITAGQNSYTKYQAVKFGGTYNSLSSVTYRVDTNQPAGSGTVGSGTYGGGGYGSGGYGGGGAPPLQVMGAVVTAYATPTTSASGDGLASMTGAAAGFGTGSTPFSTAGGSTTSTNPIYANAWRTQLQTSSSAPAGEVSTVTFTAAWTES